MRKKGVPPRKDYGPLREDRIFKAALAARGSKGETAWLSGREAAEAPVEFTAQIIQRVLWFFAMRDEHAAFSPDISPLGLTAEEILDQYVSLQTVVLKVGDGHAPPSKDELRRFLNPALRQLLARGSVVVTSHDGNLFWLPVEHGGFPRWEITHRDQRILLNGREVPLGGKPRAAFLKAFKPDAVGTADFSVVDSYKSNNTGALTQLVVKIRSAFEQRGLPHNIALAMIAHTGTIVRVTATSDLLPQ